MRGNPTICAQCHRATSIARARRLRALRPQCPSASMATATAMATAITPAPSIKQMTSSIRPIARFPRTQPPSHKPPEMRKSQLLRQYASLLRSTPMMVVFQHNNLKSVEWMGIRRELLRALRKVDETAAAARRHAGEGEDAAPVVRLAEDVKIQTVQTSIFEVALRIVEFYQPEQQENPQQGRPGSTTSISTTTQHATDPRTDSSADHIPDSTASVGDPVVFTHTLSATAHEAVNKKKRKNLKKMKAHPLAPLLSGPLALLAFPRVSPEHLKTALAILAPQPPQFAPPTRRANPAYHELPVQQGLQKLLLLGARVEGRAMDAEALRAVGLLEGGIEALRAQLVAALQGVAADVAATLEAPGRTLYLTVEGRRAMLENPEKGKEA